MADAVGYQPAEIGSDGARDAIVGWVENRNLQFEDIYAQRVDGSGQFLYYEGGLEICTGGAWQLYPVIASDGSGGAIMAWIDLRAGAEGFYAQHLTNTGLLDGGWADVNRGNDLLQNVPNPFNSDTLIAFTTKTHGEVRLQISDAKGRLVRVLLDGPAKPPVHVEEWDGRDMHGRLAPAGTYFYRVEGADWTSMKKMILTR